MHATTIVGYTHESTILCRVCVRRWAATTLEANGYNSQFVGLEDLLDRLAALWEVDREDEYTFDSDEFPKVVFASQCEEEEVCDSCAESLI